MSKSDLTFKQLREANKARLSLFKNALGQPAHAQPDGSDWSLAEWTNAVAGEVGEACNIAKKIVRGDFGKPGNPLYYEACRELCRELADVIIYADIACMRSEDSGHLLAVGGTGGFVCDKFNEVSARVDCNVKL